MMMTMMTNTLANSVAYGAILIHLRLYALIWESAVVT